MIPETILTHDGAQGFLAGPKPPPPPIPPPQPGNPFPAPPWPGPRCCQWCSRPAEVYDVDGSWCSPEHRDMDRQSEMTVWRRWSQ